MKLEEVKLNFSLSDLQAKSIQLKKGDLLYRQSENTEGFLLVLSGKIKLNHKIDDDHSFVTLITENEYFGLDEIIKPHTRFSSAVAEEDSSIIKITTPPRSIKQSEQSSKYPFPISESNLTTQILPIHLIVALEELNTLTIVHYCFLRGNLNYATELKKILFELIDGGKRELIIDLTACKTIDSSFLGTLIAVLKKVTAVEGKLVLACCNEVYRLFVMTKMDRAFEIFNSLDDAIISFNK